MKSQPSSKAEWPLYLPSDTSLEMVQLKKLNILAKEASEGFYITK